MAGVVTRVGADVRDYEVGDTVYARPRDLRIGTFAEYIAVDHADIAHTPSSLTMERAAAVPLVALAAWQARVDLARVRPGQKVLVHAGAGGLGTTAIQVARHLDAYVATTAHGNDEEKLRGLGADEVVDYTKADFAGLLSGYDVVLDSLGGDNLAKSLTVLKPGGLAISVVGPPDAAFARQIGRPVLTPVMALMSRKVRAQARKLGVRYSFFFMRADGEQLKALVLSMMRVRCARSSTARSPSTRRSMRWRSRNRGTRRARSSSSCRPQARDQGKVPSHPACSGVRFARSAVNPNVRCRRRCRGAPALGTSSRG